MVGFTAVPRRLGCHETLQAVHVPCTFAWPAVQHADDSGLTSILPFLSRDEVYNGFTVLKNCLAIIEACERYGLARKKLLTFVCEFRHPNDFPERILNHLHGTIVNAVEVSFLELLYVVHPAWLTETFERDQIA